MVSYLSDFALVPQPCFIRIELEVKLDFENRAGSGRGPILLKLLNPILGNHANIYLQVRQHYIISFLNGAQRAQAYPNSGFNILIISLQPFA
jgi:hypothetical protein